MKQIKVLITGANGQLGQELMNVHTAQYDLIGLTREQLDITNYEQCLNQLNVYKPDVVVHCAAYTAVDKAESDKDSAFLVNELGTKNIAITTEQLGIKLVYISTDYVFDGFASKPYEVEAETNPQTVYGSSKLAGEMQVKAIHSKYFIVRTSWVFGLYGHNFVKTMLQLANQGKSISVVNDQIGCPTYTHDLAQFIYELIKSEKYGLYHVTNSGQCSWHEFAKQIFSMMEMQVNLTPCTTEQFPRPAKRPPFSVLSHAEITKQGLLPLRDWQMALEHMLAQMRQST